MKMKQMYKNLKAIVPVVLVSVLVLLGAFAVVNAQGQDDGAKPANEVKEDKATYKYLAGLKLKEIATEDTYILTDGKATVLYINETAIEENLDENLPNKITKEEALEISDKLCGEGYTLERITENPYDFDILYKRYINGAQVFGGNCYVSINSKTGEVGAYRKLTFDIPKLDKPKISKEKIKEKTGADADLVVIPHTNKLVWMTKENRLMRMFDANTGKELNETESKKIMNELMKTDDGIGNLKKKSTTARYSTRSINNDEGAVFRDNDDMCDDDIQKAEASMETKRPNNQPAWDSNAADWGIVNYESTVNSILKDYEGVYYSGHGNNNCIGLGGSTQYCNNEVDTGLQTRLFVVSACYAGGNNFGTTVNNNGVTCVIGASGTISDTWWDECGNWADSFWDKATGNKDAGYQRSAHTARVQANSGTWFDYCDLNTEKGSCSIYI